MTRRKSLSLIALSNFRIWTHLGWRDLRAQYARTKIGPWWSAASLAAIVAGSSIAVGLLGDQTAASLTPRLAVGFSIWTLISNSLTEGAGLFETERSLLLNSTLDETSLVMRVIWRNSVIFLHNLPIVAIALFIGDYHLSPYILLFVPFSLLAIPALLFPVFAFARLTLWQRDLKSLLPSMIQVGFFLTPILWTPPTQGPMNVLFNINPAGWFIILVRSAVLEGHIRIDLLIRCLLVMVISILLLEISHRSMRTVRKLV